MIWFKRLGYLSFLFLVLSFSGAHAQSITCPYTGASTPGFTVGGNVFGRLAPQWNAYFGAKVDVNNGVLCNPTIIGATFSPALTLKNTSSQSGVTYSLTSSDCDSFIDFTASNSILVTVPSSLPAGCSVFAVQAGNGPIIPVAGSGTTINIPSGYLQTTTVGAIIRVDVTSNVNGSSAIASINGEVLGPNTQTVNTTSTASLLLSKLSGDPSPPGPGMVTLYTVDEGETGQATLRMLAGTSSTPTDIAVDVGSGF